jgi:hypothetical protein
MYTLRYAMTGHQLGAVRHLGQAQVAVGQPLLVVGAEQLLERGVADHAGAESARDAGHRHVVVGRADPAGGEHHIEPAGVARHRLGDVVDLVRDHRDPPELNPQRAQLADEELRVLVGELAGQDLVADDHDPGPHRSIVSGLSVMDTSGQSC